MDPPDTIESQAEAPAVQAAASAKRKNYFVRHWRGDVSLGISYWVNGVLGSFLLVLLVEIVVSVMEDAIPLAFSPALVIFVYALTIVVSVWQFVGIWRSASNHVSRGGRGAWATVVKVIVVLGLLKCSVLIYRTYIPQSVEMVRILTGDAQTPPYEIRVLPGGTEIVFYGGVRAGCAKELERVLSTAPQAKVLDIESPGGRMNEARRMVQLVRQHGLITYTSEYCFSAATLVLMSGKERVMAPGAEIGFHRGTMPGATAGQRFVMDSLLRETMRSEGVSDEFSEQVLATPSNELWYPTFEEMREAGVLSSRSYIDNGKLEDKPDYVKRLEEWGVRKPLHPDHLNLGKAAERYRKAADKGDTSAQNDLGWLYENGWGVSKDLEKAAELFQKAADKGNASAQHNLGWLYENGWGVSKDLGKAADLYRKAADKGTAHAQNNLGWLYQNGLGVTKNLTKAAELFRKAADQGFPRGQSNLGWLYENGWGVPKDLTKAAELFQKAADKEDASAQNNLGCLYENGLGVPKDLEKAAKLYQKAADQGFPRGQNNLGFLYENGWGVAKDLTKAAELFQKAADQGDAAGQNNVGSLYVNGQGVPKDLDKAVELYRKAADQGYALGQNNLGSLYANGQGVPKDLGKAAELFQKAADQGDALGQSNLGWVYANGQGMPKDLGKAAELFQKAADQGFPIGQSNLGWLYENGWGVPKDLGKAAELYQKAANQGYQPAIAHLKRLSKH
jgi:TPR repeat protein